jgi:hypothetical protein
VVLPIAKVGLAWQALSSLVSATKGKEAGLARIRSASHKIAARRRNAHRARFGSPSRRGWLESRQTSAVPVVNAIMLGEPLLVSRGRAERPERPSNKATMYPEFNEITSLRFYSRFASSAA